MSKISDFLIKPNSPEEENYCKRHNIFLKRLENGITLIGIHARKDSTAFGHVKWSFSQGAYNNPPGVVHFLEHFINKKVRIMAERNSLKLSAHTNQIEVGESVAGVANPDVLDYGIWQVLEKIRQSLQSPLGMVEDLEKEIASEKQVIKTEIRQRNGFHDIHLGQYFRNTIYATDNPLNDLVPVIGFEEDIDKIDLEVLKNLEEKIFTPDGLIIGFYTEGDQKTNKILGDKLFELFSDFPRQNQSSKKMDISKFEKINPGLIANKEYQHNTGLKNGLVTTKFVWILKNQFPSVSHFALRKMESVIATEIFAYARRMGWAYHTSTEFVRLGNGIGILTIRIDTRKGEKREFLNGIREVLKSTYVIVESICELEQERQLATPMSVTDRFSWLVDGIRDYGAMLNADKMREQMLKVQPDDLKDIINELLSTEPIMLVVGDLS